MSASLTSTTNLPQRARTSAVCARAGIALFAAVLLCAPGSAPIADRRFAGGGIAAPASRSEVATTGVLAPIETGVWYDREHSGHGLDLYRVGASLFGTFYTYDARGAVEWFGVQPDEADASRLVLTRYRSLATGLVASVDGAMRLTPVASCPDARPRTGARALLRMDFVLDGNVASWCLEPLLPAVPDPLALLSGAWYAPSDPGWGVMSHAFTAADGSHQVFRIVYFHDVAGNPRWAFAQDRYAGVSQTQTYYTPYVECLGCPSSTLLTVPIGRATVMLTKPLHVADGARNRVMMSLRFEGGAAFERDAALALLTPVVGGESAQALR